MIEMDAAEHRLETVAQFVATVVRESEAVRHEAARNVRQPTDEQVDRFKAYVGAYVHTPEWQRVKARIAQGELTWRDIASGAAITDPGVAAARRSMRSVPPPSRQMLADLGLVDPAPPPTPAEQLDPPEPAPSPRPTDDDDYFDGFTTRESVY